MSIFKELSEQSNIIEGILRYLRYSIPDVGFLECERLLHVDDEDWVFSSIIVTSRPYNLYIVKQVIPLLFDNDNYELMVSQEREKLIVLGWDRNDE